MKIAIIGSRGFTNYKLMVGVLGAFGFDKDGNEIVSGNAKKGADVLAKAFAEDSNLKFTDFPSQWKGTDNDYYNRNKHVISYSDFVICFWDGDSTGTRNSIEIARQMKKPTFIVYF